MRRNKERTHSVERAVQNLQWTATRVVSNEQKRNRNETQESNTEEDGTRHEYSLEDERLRDESEIGLQQDTRDLDQHMDELVEWGDTEMRPPSNGFRSINEPVGVVKRLSLAAGPRQQGLQD